MELVRLLASISLRCVPSKLNSCTPFLKATQEEIVDIACKFPAGKSAGYDNIPMSIIKRSISSISSPLTHIVNLSIIHGIVPNESVKNCSCGSYF